MADLVQMERALRNADAAAARALVKALMQARAATPDPAQAVPSADDSPQQAPAVETFRERERRVAAMLNDTPLRASVITGMQGVTSSLGDEVMAGLMTPVEMATGALTREDAGKGVMSRVGDAYERAHQ